MNVFSTGNNPTDHFNAWLKILMLCDVPSDRYKNFKEKQALKLFFLYDDKFIKPEEDYIAYRLCSRFNTVNDIPLKDDFTIKHSVWYNAGIYAWLVVFMCTVSLFVPLETTLAIPVLLCATIGLITMYVFNRYRLKRKFQRIAEQIITYHERIKIIRTKRRPVYGANYQRGSVAFYLESLGIDINETHNY